MSHEFNPADSIKAKQQKELLQALRLAPVSTIDARDALVISHPVGRVLELRRQGYSIATSASTVYDSSCKSL